MTIDVGRRRPLLGAIHGGLSGPAIRPVGVRFVYDVYPEVDIPIIGVGGIATLDDALEYILAGATASSGRHRHLRPTNRRPDANRRPRRLSARQSDREHRRAHRRRPRRSLTAGLRLVC